MKKLIPFLALLACVSSSASLADVITDDSDLSPPTRRRQPEVPVELKPDQVQFTEDASGMLKIQVVRQDRGKLTPVTDLALTSTDEPRRAATTGSDGRATLAGCAQPGSTVRVEARLRAEHFTVGNGRELYRIAFTAPCSGTVTASFQPDSSAGQAVGIWQIATSARAKLRDSVGLGFWKSPLEFVWPDEADFYRWGSVHISRGDHWDVVGHEMGHGIYDLARVGRFGGGPHKIDECYSTELALSEGWASYFSAWVSLDMADPDARFEYMVPRRAPIRIENIPEDVCKGEKNEWRVTGYLWDLIDLHADGENSSAPFAKVWEALAGSKSASMSDGLKRLEAAGFDPVLLKALWNLNFQE